MNKETTRINYTRQQVPRYIALGAVINAGKLIILRKIISCFEGQEDAREEEGCISVP